MNYKIEDGVLITTVLCADRKLQELEVESILWIDYAIDMEGIYALKNSEFGGGAYKDTTGIFIYNEYFVVPIPYKTMLKEWLKFKKDNALKNYLIQN